MQMTISKVEKYMDLTAKISAGTPGSSEVLSANAQLQHVKEWCEADIVSDDFLKRYTQDGSNEEKGAQSMQVSLYAYAKVMRKRLCDIVPQMVHTALVADVAQRLQPHLLAAMSPERLHAGAVDSTSVAKRRAAAEQRLKNFTDALEQLSTIGVSASSPAGARTA